MDSFLLKLLNYLELTPEDYDKLRAPVTVGDLPDVSAFSSYFDFIARVEVAITRDEEVLIYGDYDADGILATSILKYAFMKRGKKVNTMIPSRYKDGYGINRKIVEKLIKRDIHLIITVDNGVSQHEAIALARANGIDVLVSDHHEIGATLPNANAILHPLLSTLPSINSCGAYMALVISYGILGYYDDYLVTLAAIATIADMMPLVGRNRTLVRLGIENVNQKQYFPLVRLSDGNYFDENTFGMRIAPRINALGRLSQNYEANILVEYFTTDDPKRIYEIAAYVERVYEERKKMSKASDLTPEEMEHPAIVLISDELEGVLGLLAQSYVQTFNKPSVVFTESSENPTLLKGSARSSHGFNVVEAFAALKPLIIASGGHPEAGGLTIKRDNFSAFKHAFNALAEANPLVAKEDKYFEVTFEEINVKNYEIINELAPFGFKWPSPKLSVLVNNPGILKTSRDGKHIISPLESGVKLIGFSLGEQIKNLKICTLYGHFSKSIFNGKPNIDFRISILK